MCKYSKLITKFILFNLISFPENTISSIISGCLNGLKQNEMHMLLNCTPNAW